MIVKNLTKKTAMGKNAKLVDGVISQSIGLMFSKKQNKDLIFKFSKEKTISLHMFFVFYPIDVLFLDKNKIVVDKKENFKPFAFYKSKEKAMYAIELPDGTIKKTKTEIGDRVEF
ncbi:DUF192 domain-containing protein [Candidatus Woesearchaeota archaeon]|nr:DUF192 domain-containing protein [Candidatus Woesearchaeota archaeon]